MELYAERLRLSALAEAEARGESLWTTDISEPVRIKLARAWRNAADGIIVTDPYAEGADGSIRQTLEISIGRQLELDAGYHLQIATEPELVLSLLEAMDRAFGEAGLLDAENGQSFFRSEVNRILETHRIAFRLIDGEIIPMESFELNSAVVEPVLYLLHGHAELRNTHAAYMKALQEIRAEDPGDAITDAGTALTEMLEALGCEGRNLGALISSAKKKALLGAHDSHLTDAIEKTLVWVAAERNRGEAHHITNAHRSDAWLMVHVVGALIVRLAESGGLGVPPRGQ